MYLHLTLFSIKWIEKQKVNVCEMWYNEWDGNEFGYIWEKEKWDRNNENNLNKTWQTTGKAN